MFILLAASLIPPFYLMWRVYQIDKIEKEPAGLLFNIFLLGMLSTLPAGIIESILSSVLTLSLPADFTASPGGQRIFNLIMYFIIVAGAEEGVKYLAMKIPSWKHPEFDYVFDGVIYGVFAAAGFAALENVLYVMESGLLTAGVRAWTAIPLHIIAGVFMGHYYGIAKSAQIHGEYHIMRKMKRRSILIPMLIHGFYDFCATDAEPMLALIFLIYIVVLDVLALRALHRFAQSDMRLY